MATDAPKPDPALLAIAGLIAAEREERGDLEIPNELILTEAGFSPAEVAPMLGKSAGAVREKARRAKTASEKGSKK